MNLSVCLCVSLVLSGCVALASKQELIDKDTGNGATKIEGYSVKRREKRVVASLTRFAGKAAAAVLRGKQATKQLLSGARMTSNGPFYRRFEKHGGLSAAVKDFEDIDPSLVHKYEDKFLGFIWTAKVGDRTVLLSERGMNNLPEIMINLSEVTVTRGKFDNRLVDVIIYKN